MLEKEIIAPILYLLWILSIAVALVYSIQKNIVLDIVSRILAGVAFGVAAFRSNEFPDYEEYLEIYRITSDAGFSNVFDLNLHGEIGFKLIILLLDLFFENSISIFLFSAVASFSLLVLLARRLNLSFPQVWIGYFSFYFITKDLGQIRYSVASLLVIYAYTLSGVAGKTMVATISSLFFQYFSFFPILISKIVEKIEFRWFSVLGLMFGAVVASFFLGFDFLTLIAPAKIIDNYYGTEYVSGSMGGPVQAIFRSLLVCIFLYYAIQGAKLSAVERNLIVTIPVSIFFYIIFWQVPIVSQRIGGFFASAIPFVIAIAIRVPRNGLVLLFYFALCSASFNAFYFSVSYL